MSSRGGRHIIATKRNREPTVADVLAIIAKGTDGFWFDGTNLWQTSPANTEADDAGESIGLALERSLLSGLPLATFLLDQPELVPDPDNKAAYSVTNCTIDDPSGVLTITATGSSNNIASQDVPTVAGKYYYVTVEVRAPSANTSVNAARLYTSSLTSAIASEDEWVTRTVVLQAAGSSVTVGVQCASGSVWGAIGDTTEFRNLSVKEVPGNHGVQTTSGSRPTLQAGPSMRFDGSDDHIIQPVVADVNAGTLIGLANVVEIGGNELIIGAGGASNEWCAIEITTDGPVGGRVGNVSSNTLRGSANRRNMDAFVGLTYNASIIRLYGEEGEGQIDSAARSGDPTTVNAPYIGAANVEGSPAGVMEGDVYHAIFIKGYTATAAEIALIRTVLYSLVNN